MIKSELVVGVGVDEKIDATVRRMASEAHRVRHVGVAVVQDDAQRVVGIVTDGDIRRAYAADIPFTEPVRRIMSPDPVSVPVGLPIEQVPAEVLRRIRQGGRLKADIVRHVLVTDPDGRLVEIYDSLSLLAQTDQPRKNVAVYGQDRAGLSLAVALAEYGHSVTGIDLDAALVELLDAGILPVEQTELADALGVALEGRTLRFAVPGSASNSDTVHIMTVETNLAGNGAADLSAIANVATVIGRRLRANDLVMLRGRSPIGTARDLVRKTLEKVSGLRAGEEFALAVTPEYAHARIRAAGIEGVPQIVGGLTSRCSARAAGFWNALTAVVIPVESVEAAEFAALASGAFGNLSAALADELAVVADRHNINVYALAASIERGDPQFRSQFLKPAALAREAPIDASLLGLSLRALERDPKDELVLYPAEIVSRFARRCRVAVQELKIVVLGLADDKNAVGEGVAVLASARVLAQLGCEVGVRASGMSVNDIRGSGLISIDDVATALGEADCVIVFGHGPIAADLRLNVPAEGARRLIFDANGRLDRTAIEASPGHVYATIGYMTPPKFAVIACDNGFGHVRRCAAIAAALRERGATCDLFVPPELASRLDSPTIAFRTHSNPEGWRRGALETIHWPDRLPVLGGYDFVLADSLPEILRRRPDAILIGHFLWTHALSDVDETHAVEVDALLRRFHPRMLGTGLLASDRLKSTTRYEDVGLFAAAELDFLPPKRDELLVSTGLGAEDEAVTRLREVVALLATMTSPPAPFALVHVEPGLLPENAPRWMIPASYEPVMYRGLAAAIMRPGAGTVTDCLCRGVWMIWPQSPDHDEIVRNAQTLAARGLGVTAASPREAVELACTFAADPNRLSDMLVRCRALRFDGAARVADILMDELRSDRGAPDVRSAAVALGI